MDRALVWATVFPDNPVRLENPHRWIHSPFSQTDKMLVRTGYLLGPRWSGFFMIDVIRPSSAIVFTDNAELDFEVML
ncbi:hypothetical protein FA13DRAFT_1732118 [Coprinellus micaceus]|uniref:Uncharacterized protein n=1 Tax=Coprinellus micaceus TaxID=71717 RepID=A0A4Y7TCY9_COPMI|nr:hypothetical protein FA13DRAFT_1732118 [Coprinellus micaceus]